MMFHNNKNLILAFCVVVMSVLALTATATPAPLLSDTHKTSLELYAKGKLEEAGKFAVSVKRLDEVVDTDEQGNVVPVAEKLTDIIIMFDVKPDGSITANDVPVPMGLNHVKVHAVTISAISKKAAKKTNHTLAEIKQSYDMGIIGMSIEARAEKFPVVTDAKTGAVLKMVTKLTLIENILEVNGEKVEQTIAMQQVFEITSLSDNDNKESEVKKLAPMPCTALSVPHLAAIADHRRTQLHHSRIRHNRHHLLHHNKKACGLNAMSAWVSKQSVPVKLALSSLFGVFIAMVVLMFAKLVSMMVMVRRRGRGGAATHDEYARVESMEEMNLGDKAQLPAYTFAILDVKQADTKQ